MIKKIYARPSLSVFSWFSQPISIFGGFKIALICYVQLLSRCHWDISSEITLYYECMNNILLCAEKFNSSFQKIKYTTSFLGHPIDLIVERRLISAK